MSNKSHSLVRPLVRHLQPYVPGEQPKIRGLIKLNTNENPYPPSPRVLKAIKAAVDGRLRLYPNPTAERLREKLARFHGCGPENIIIGNGSDELLALATRCFVEPGQSVQYLSPSYSLYPVLAEIHGAQGHAVALEKDFGLPKLDRFKANAPLTFITTPNAPSGRGYATAELERVCHALNGVVVLDEAYVEFADDNAMGLALKYPNVLVSRTFSKAYSLCFLRVGYFVGPAELIEALHKIRDSYNVNGLAQVAAEATLDDLPHYRRSFRKVIATRERLRGELASLGFDVPPSQTNFIFARPPRLEAAEWLEKLRQRRVLVRWFRYPETREYLRITVGAEKEASAMVKAARAILGNRK